MRRRKVCLTDAELDKLVAEVKERLLASMEAADSLDELREEVQQLKRMLRNRNSQTLKPTAKTEGAP